MPARCLTCLLVCEGPSDRWYLTEVLRRSIDAICVGLSDIVVEVEIRSVRADHQQPQSIMAALRDAGPFDALLYHHDGAPPSTSDLKVTEVCRGVSRTRCEPVVTVVPVRETEAWMLADREAIARVIGIRAGSVQDIVPQQGRFLEDIGDPKAALKSVLDLAGRRGRLNVDRADIFGSLAEHVNLDLLRTVPSFAQWWSDMTEALKGLGYNNG